MKVELDSAKLLEYLEAERECDKVRAMFLEYLKEVLCGVTGSDNGADDIKYH